MSLVQTILPTEELVSLEEVKSHIHVDYFEDDTLLYNLIQAASQHLEVTLSRQFLTSTFVLGLDQFPNIAYNRYRDRNGIVGGWYQFGAMGGWYQNGIPTGWKHTGRTISLPRPPLQSIVSVVYSDTDNVLQTLPNTVYAVDTLSEPGQLYLLPRQVWPSTSSIPNAVKITYVAGWAKPGLVPESIRALLLLLVAHLYKNPIETFIEQGIRDLPLAFKMLFWSNRILEA